MLDLLLGLPAHPLLVHVPVVLLPLVALGVIALAARPAWRPRFAGLLLAVAAVAALGAVGAALTGDALAAQVGTPSVHRSLGIALAVGSVLFVVVVGPWLWRVRTPAVGEDSPGRTVMGLVSAGLAVVLVGLTMLTGHSGATAVWGDVSGTGTSTAAAAEPTPSTGPMASPSASGGAPEPATPVGTAGFTMADVTAHDSRESCWAAIDGRVYDLTEWITRHPGGAERILALCGTDATSAFTTQHQGQPEPTDQLAEMLLGTLSR